MRAALRIATCRRMTRTPPKGCETSGHAKTGPSLPCGVCLMKVANCRPSLRPNNLGLSVDLESKLFLHPELHPQSPDRAGGVFEPKDSRGCPHGHDGNQFPIAHGNALVASDGRLLTLCHLDLLLLWSFLDDAVEPDARESEMLPTLRRVQKLNVGIAAYQVVNTFHDLLEMGLMDCKSIAVEWRPIPFVVAISVVIPTVARHEDNAPRTQPNCEVSCNSKRTAPQVELRGLTIERWGRLIEEIVMTTKNGLVRWPYPDCAFRVEMPSGAFMVKSIYPDPVVGGTRFDRAITHYHSRDAGNSPQT